MIKSSIVSAEYIQTKEISDKVREFFILLRALVVRDIKGRYRRSLLGPAWAVLQPLSYMVIFIVIRSILNISSEGMPYVVFTYSALVPWTFFSNSVTRATSSISSNKGIIKKMGVILEVFPVSCIIASCVDFMISFLILIGMIIWFGISLSWSMLWLPLLAILIALFALGVGLATASFGTYKHDIIFVMPFLMQFWLLITPIMYPLGQVPERWKLFYSLNPMVGIIEGFRMIMVKGMSPDFSLLGFSLMGTAIIWIIAWPLFRYMSKYFVDVL